ncbi:hypothetical protein LTS10_000245 [Elasticomyces elasticus]|nr:hypothetical protein LTS10_000245 [Elasticomyces elasticus]
MHSNNEREFWYARYEQALQAWKDNQHAEADNICIDIIADFASPPFIKVQALQIRARCTTQYYDSRSLMSQCFPILDGYLTEDPTVAKLRDQATRFITQLDRNWQAKWTKLGKKPPKSKELERRREQEFDAAEAAEAAQAAKIDAVQKATGDLSRMELDAASGDASQGGPDSKDDKGEASPKPPGSSFVTGNEFNASEQSLIPPLGPQPYTASEIEGLEDWARDQTEEEMEQIELAHKFAAQELQQWREQRAQQQAERGEGGEGEGGEGMEGVEKTDTSPTGAPPSPPDE